MQHVINFGQNVLSQWVAQRKADENDWVFFADCDEFLYCPTQEALRTRLSATQADQVHVPWLFYGHSFRIEDNPNALVLGQYTYHAAKLSAIHKSLCRVSALMRASSLSLWSNFIHEPLRLDKVQSEDLFSADLPSAIHLAHFSKLSVKNTIWRKASRRSPASEGLFTANHIIKMLFWSDADNEECLGLMQPYLEKLQQKLPWVRPVAPLSQNPQDLLDCALYCPSMSEPVIFFRPDINTLCRHTLFQILCCPDVRFCRRDELLPSGFDAGEYLALNSDLQGLSKRSLEAHFVCAGRFESRPWTAPPLPDDFDAEKYADLNPDLQGLSAEYLISHWRLHGLREGRSYRMTSKQTPLSSLV
jgi:hypothetical protein